MSDKINQKKQSSSRNGFLPILGFLAALSLMLLLPACGGDSADGPAAEETDAEVVVSDASQPVVTDASTVTSDASEPAPGCGDGVKSGDEGCDDGNDEDGDGCARDCSIEAGFVCSEDEAGKSSCECASGFDPDKKCADCLPGLWGDAC